MSGRERKGEPKERESLALNKIFYVWGKTKMAATKTLGIYRNEKRAFL